jgi:hypothetical protein
MAEHVAVPIIQPETKVQVTTNEGKERAGLALLAVILLACLWVAAPMFTPCSITAIQVYTVHPQAKEQQQEEQQLEAQVQQGREQYKELYMGLEALDPCFVGLVMAAVDAGKPEVVACSLQYQVVQAKWESTRSQLEKEFKQLKDNLSGGWRPEWHALYDTLKAAGPSPEPYPDTVPAHVAALLAAEKSIKQATDKAYLEMRQGKIAAQFQLVDELGGLTWCS